MTSRIYYTDPYCRRFEAVVTRAFEHEGRPAALLDRTAFYPTSGGQPFDTGRITPQHRGPSGSATDVLETIDLDDDIVHILAAPLAAGAAVTAEIDWARRFDHMQQHTGQHILSRAFVEVARADTRSFHLGEAVVTIDVEHTGPDAALLRRVEERANAIVWEDRPVATHVVSLERAREFPLRKPPDVEGEVRVVEVLGFDWSACGGTHVARSGQVGIIAILGTERYKGGARVAFACGGRALGRLRETTDLLRGLCLEFTSGEADLPRAIARLKGEVRSLESRLKPLLADAIAREAESLLAGAERGAAGPVVARYFPDRDPAELSALAGHVASRGGIALLAAGTDIARAHFSAPNGTISVGALFADLCRAYGAKGGGRPEAAQGAIPAERAREAIDAARRAALAGTNQG